MSSNEFLIEQPSKGELNPPCVACAPEFILRAAQYLFIITGVSIGIWTVLNTYYLNNEKTINSKICLPLTAAGVVISIGIFINTRWNKFVFWIGLAFLGQTASLQMIDAGRLLHYQHYQLLPELINENLILVIILAIQFVAVSVGISKKISSVRNWLKTRFPVWKLLVIAVFLSLAGAAVTPDISIYLTSLSLAAFVQIISLLNIVLLAWSIPQEAVLSLRGKIENLIGKTNEVGKTHRLDLFAYLAAGWIILLAGMFSYFVYENHPHIADEAQYIFQARYMAAGQFTINPPLAPESFNVYMIPYQDERWFSIFPPAWAAMLAIGLKLNVVWLINPLLAGVGILLAYLFFQELYSRRFARIAILLLCCSPWFVFMAMNFMSHNFALVTTLAAAVLMRRGVTFNKTLYFFFSGLLLGILSLNRPLDGLIFVFLITIWTLTSCQKWLKKLLNSSVLGIGTIMTGALILPYNKIVTGSFLTMPINYYYTKYFWEGANSIGFGPQYGFHWQVDAFPGHSPLEAVINAAVNTFSLNTELFGWVTGSLVILVVFLFSGKINKKDYWAIITIAGVIGVYSFYWFSGGPDFGARYWFSCIIPLIALTVRGIEWLNVEIRQIGDEKVAINPRVMTAIGTLCLMSLICYFPWRVLDKYYHYLEMQPGILKLSNQHNFGKSLILIRGGEQPDYLSAWIYNPLNFEGDAPLYAWDKDPQIRTKLLKSYIDRPVWIIDGPTVTNDGYKIVCGPVDARELLANESQ